MAVTATATVVQKINITSTSKTGTPVRIVQYYLTAPKLTQNDWVNLETDIGTTGNSIIALHGIIDNTPGASGNMSQETLTYTNATDRLVLGAATTGTVHLFVLMSEA